MSVEATSEADEAVEQAPVLDEHALLQIRNLTQEFVVGKSWKKANRATVYAVSDVSFDVHNGETLGVVGETGCGKSTLVRAIVQAPPPKSGNVIFQGKDLKGLKGQELASARRHMQMVFQDPYTSLDPRWKVKDLVAEPLVIHKIGSSSERDARVAELLRLVGLDPDRHGDRRPRQLSGGECQRVAIARALTLSPELVICDEAVSSLDVSIQAQILNLFEQLKEELGLAYLFIAHDLAVVKHISERVAVMYLGKIVELSPAEDLYLTPFHPYTTALLSAVLTPDPDAKQTAPLKLSGEPPSPLNPPSGCRFRTRCPYVQAKCAEEEPPLRELAPNHSVACHFPLNFAV